MKNSKNGNGKANAGNGKQPPQNATGNGAKAVPKKAVPKTAKKVVLQKKAKRTMLSMEQVRAIKKALAKGVKQSELAKKYDYEPGNLSRIANNKLWADIK